MAPMRILLLGALLFSASCTEARDKECVQVCEKESSCADTIDNYRFDQDECVTACSALRRDTQGNEYFKRHMECVNDAPSCPDLYRKCTFAYDQPTDQPADDK
jgi:hypothetical protein